jgi:lipopolysaccharide/colanic/teichoic acid biosynthesis glycosyltransferase
MIAGCLIVMLLPIYSMVSILIYIAMGKPILFRQKRPGYHGEIFEILKFRTMTNTQDREGNLLSDEKRLLGLGKWIRSTSLDELPQLVNVLKGDMSFVGPRPLLIEYLPLYTKKQSRRHEVKPGITGWAQINGRNAISWEEKFRYDIWYVDHFSFWLDLKIMWMTLIKVFARKDVNSKTSLTMEKFKGSRET